MEASLQEKINQLSIDIEIDPLNQSFIEERSSAYLAIGDWDGAISDFCKLLVLEPTRKNYVNRSKLYQEKKMYSEAVEDLKGAKNLNTFQEGEDPTIDVFLQKSLCMVHYEQTKGLAEMVKDQEAIFGQQNTQKYRQTLEELLRIKDSQIEKQRMEHKLVVAQLTKYYEQQNNKLQRLLLEQYNQLRKKMQIYDSNYETKFSQQLELSHLKESQKRKMRTYFNYFSSQMEKYYVAAKNLHKFDDKTIKIEDIESIMQKNSKKDYMKVLYKLFDKYSSKVEQIQNLVKEIPYIGSVFSIIKLAARSKGWMEQVNLEHQCLNIQRIAINITMFNQFATNLAYYMCKRYKNAILGGQKSYQSIWERLVKTINRIKHQNLGNSFYKCNLQEDEQRVKEYAIVHASILMVAYACNSVPFTRQSLSDANKRAEINQKEANNILEPLFSIVNQIQLILKIRLKPSQIIPILLCRISRKTVNFTSDFQLIILPFFPDDLSYDQFFSYMQRFFVLSCQVMTFF